MPRHKNNMQAAEYRKLRRNINQGFRRDQVNMYKEARSVLIRPSVDNVTKVGVHLTPDKQSVYNRCPGFRCTGKSRPLTSLVVRTRAKYDEGEIPYSINSYNSQCNYNKNIWDLHD